jgi:hypothetical protein
MIDEDVKQTRCTTCDAEHVYKGGKAPRRKKSESTGGLYKEVLAGIEEPTVRITVTDEVVMADSSRPDEEEAPAAAEPAGVEADEVEDDDSQIHLLPPDEGPVHRPLIRAQLPRPEGMKVERQAPEFTIRQNSGGRPGGFRGRGHGGNGSGNGSGHGSGHGGQRFGRGPMRSGHGGGGGFNRGHGGGNQQRQGGGPRKRSR